MLKHLVRPNILKLKPYSSARSEFKGEGNFTLLDANENPYNNGLNRYPDPLQLKLKKRLSEIKNIPAKQIFLSNGSDEAIGLITTVFCEPGQDNIIILPPTFGMYRVAADVANVEVREVSLTPDFQPNVDAILAAADDHSKVLFICTPNNPIGNSIQAKHIRELLGKFKGIVVVDEAYIDFSEQESCTNWLGEFPNLIITQTFSKGWGMAGVRLGMTFASEEIVGYLNKVKMPYNVNELTQWIAMQALENQSEVQTRIQTILQERKKLEAALSRFSFVKKIFLSDANFLLVQVENPRELYDFLIEKNIIVRNRANVPMCEGSLRFSVGTERENEWLVRCLEAFSSPSTPQPPPKGETALFSHSGNELSPFGGGKGVDNPILKFLSQATPRTATVQRTTKETDINIRLNLDGTGKGDNHTGIGFFDHMLDQLARHSGADLRVHVQGDLHIDEHHTIEDTALALGEAYAQALGDKRGIERYGFCLPMDDCLVQVALDFGGRPWLVWEAEFRREMIGQMPTEMFIHFFKSFSDAAKCNLNIKAEGSNEHHKIEGIFKAFAKAIKMAVRRDFMNQQLPTTKGII